MLLVLAILLLYQSLVYCTCFVSSHAYYTAWSLFLEDCCRVSLAKNTQLHIRLRLCTDITLQGCFVPSSRCWFWHHFCKRALRCRSPFCLRLLFSCSPLFAACSFSYFLRFSTYLSLPPLAPRAGRRTGGDDAPQHARHGPGWSF